MEEEEESVILKLSRPPIPLDDLDQLADAITLYERMPYSGMEYGYYHGVVNNSIRDVFRPVCVRGRLIPRVFER